MNIEESQKHAEEGEYMNMIGICGYKPWESNDEMLFCPYLQKYTKSDNWVVCRGCMQSIFSSSGAAQNTATTNYDRFAAAAAAVE